MSSALRFRLALAWEELRVPAALLLFGFLLVGTYVPALAHVQVVAALVATPVLGVWLASRSLWHEATAIRQSALVVALSAGAAALVCMWGPPLWQARLTFVLWAAAPGAALVQILAARRGARSFFAALTGIVIALGLLAPPHVGRSPGSVFGAWLVAVGIGGGAGLLMVALADRFAPSDPPSGR